MERRIFVLLFIAVFATTIGLSIIEPFMALYAESLGASGLYIGLIFASFTIARGLATPFIGKLSDHHGRKNFIIAGLLAYTISSFLYLYADNLELLIIVRLLQGMSSAFVAPIAMAYIGDITPKGKEGTYMGTFTMSMFLGLGLGPIIGGGVNHEFGMRAAFLSMTILGLISLLVVSALLPELGKHRSKKPTEFLQIIKDRGMQEILLVRFITSFGVAGYIVFLPLFAAEHGMNTAVIGAIVTMNLLITTLLQRYFGNLADRHNKLVLVMVGNLLMGLTILLIPLTKDLVSLFLVNVFMGLGGAIAIPANTALAAQFGRLHGMGSAMGLLQTSFSLGLTVGPIIAGLIHDTFGITWVFIYTGIVVVLGTIMLYFFVQRKLQSFYS